MCHTQRYASDTDTWGASGRLGDNVFCNVQLEATCQREDAAHVALVDINFLKPHV